MFSGSKRAATAFTRPYPSGAADGLVELDQHVALRATWQGTQQETGAVLNQVGLVLMRVDGSGKIAERVSRYAPQP